MKKRELEILDHFLTRTTMWVSPINEISTVSFIHGFETGIDSKAFTSELKEYIESEYDIYGSNSGWPHQVQLYAKMSNQSWNEAFMELGKLTLEKLKINLL